MKRPIGCASRIGFRLPKSGPSSRMADELYRNPCQPGVYDRSRRGQASPSPGLRRLQRSDPAGRSGPRTEGSLQPGTCVRDTRLALSSSARVRATTGGRVLREPDRLRNLYFFDLTRADDAFEPSQGSSGAQSVRVQTGRQTQCALSAVSKRFESSGVGGLRTSPACM